VLNEHAIETTGNDDRYADSDVWDTGIGCDVHGDAEKNSWFPPLIVSVKTIQRTFGAHCTRPTIA
jgi:hypothetical protein